MSKTLAEIVDKQNIIIKSQSDIIYDILTILAQYMTQNEIDSLPAVSKINALADIKAGIS
jgi:hypothetical protein